MDYKKKSRRHDRDSLRLKESSLLNSDALNQAVGARAHLHNVVALMEHIEVHRVLHLLEACHRAALQVKHIDVHPFSPTDMEHTAFDRKCHRIHALRHGKRRFLARRGFRSLFLTAAGFCRARRFSRRARLFVRSNVYND